MDMRVSISEIIRIASIFSVSIPLIFYVANLKNSSRAIHATGALIIISGIADIIGSVLFDQHRSNALIYNIQDTLQFTLLSWIFLELISLRKLRIILYSGIVVYIVSLITVTLFFQSFIENQTIMWAASGIIILIFSIIFFFYLLSGLPTPNILTFPYSWINAGIFFYFSFSLYLFVISDYLFLKVEREAALLIWSFHNINNIIKNILFAVGISLMERRKG